MRSGTGVREGNHHMLGTKNRWTGELLQFRMSLEDMIIRYESRSPQGAALQRSRVADCVTDFDIGDISAAQLLEEFARIKYDILRSR